MGGITVEDLLAQYENWAQDKSGLPVADSGWFSAAVYEQFIAARATDVQKGYKDDPLEVAKSAQQTLGCVELEEVRVEECPCAPPSGCTWKKTVLPIPSYIGQPIAVTGIGGNLELLQHYTYRDWQAVKYSLKATEEAERTRGYYCIRNNYLYIITSEHIKAISVAAIFYDPVDAYRHPSCGQEVDYCPRVLEMSLYTDPGKYQSLLAQSFQVILAMRNNVPFDVTNNAQPSFGLEAPREY